MRKTLLLTAFMACAFAGKAQIDSGSKLFKTGFELNTGITKSASYWDSNLHDESTSSGLISSLFLTYGKVRSDKLLLYYGFGTSYYTGSSKAQDGDGSKFRSVSLGPVVGLQKFYEIIPKVFYIPEAYLQTTLEHKRSQSSLYPGNDAITKRLAIGLHAIPFSVGFQIRKNIISTFYVGRASLIYADQTDTREQIDNFKAKVRSLDFAFNTNSFTLGAIFLLN